MGWRPSSEGPLAAKLLNVPRANEQAPACWFLSYVREHVRDGLVAIGTDSHGSREGSGEQVVGVMPHTPEAVMSTPLQLSAPGGKRGGLVVWPGVEDRTCSR